MPNTITITNIIFAIVKQMYTYMSFKHCLKTYFCTKGQMMHFSQSQIHFLKYIMGTTALLHYFQYF